MRLRNHPPAHRPRKYVVTFVDLRMSRARIEPTLVTSNKRKDRTPVQTTSMIDTTSDYRRQQLLTEAARDRLANQAISRSSARHNRPKTPLLARLIMAAMLLAASFASPLGGTLPA